MNVIFGYVALYYFDIHAVTNFPYQIPYSDCHVSNEYRLAILRYPYKMKLYIIYTM